MSPFFFLPSAPRSGRFVSHCHRILCSVFRLWHVLPFAGYHAFCRSIRLRFDPLLPALLPSGCAAFPLAFWSYPWSGAVFTEPGGFAPPCAVFSRRFRALCYDCFSLPFFCFSLFPSPSCVCPPRSDGALFCVCYPLLAPAEPGFLPPFFLCPSLAIWLTSFLHPSGRRVV